LEAAGLIASGVNPDTGLVEIIELKNHPFFIGVQYHPEYKSTVANPHPIFVSFVAAMVKHKK
jgi:CTP synthase